jgi:hypothetical protein
VCGPQIPARAGHHGGIGPECPSKLAVSVTDHGARNADNRSPVRDARRLVFDPSLASDFQARFAASMRAAGVWLF